MSIEQYPGKVRVKTRKDMTGCVCGSKEMLRINSPVTGHTCPDCGATKDKYEQLQKAFAAARAVLDFQFDTEGIWPIEELKRRSDAYKDAVREMEE